MQPLWKAVIIAIVFLAMAGTILYVPQKLYQKTTSGTMDYLIAFELAAVALVGSIAAIFGDTITKDIKAPLYRRLTLRGWVAIACIVLTFGLESMKDKVSIDGERNQSKQRTLVREDITQSLEMLHVELRQNKELLTHETKEIESKMEFTKCGLQQSTATIESEEQEFQNQFAELKMELGSLTDKDHGLQPQNSTPNSVWTDKETAKKKDNN